MTTYHPDPELLDALATVWDNKATELETLATTSHAGFAADTSTMVWRGNAKNEAYETSVAISNSVKKTATACREFAKSLREMADEVRKKLAELAKQELKAFLMAIVGLILGIAVGFALGPLISSMAAWLAGALALASEIATLVATLTFEFVIGSLVYGALQFGMDMAFEGIAAAATGTEFHIEGNAWQSVLIGGLTGGLFSLNPAKIGALHKNIWKTGGPSVTPPKVDPAPAPVTNSTPGGGTFTPVDRPGGGIGLSSADDIRIDVGGAGGPGTIPKLGPETPGVGAPGVRPGGGVVPEPPPAISASSFNRTDPAGGGLGTPGVGNTSRPLPPPGTENALLRPPPARPGSVDAPGVVTGPQGPPRVNLDRPVAPGGENITPPVVRGESGAPANTGGTPVTQRPTPPPATPETATAPPTPAPGGRPPADIPPQTRPGSGTPENGVSTPPPVTRTPNDTTPVSPGPVRANTGPDAGVSTPPPRTPSETTPGTPGVVRNDTVVPEPGVRVPPPEVRTPAPEVRAPGDTTPPAVRVPGDPGPGTVGPVRPGAGTPEPGVPTSPGNRAPGEAPPANSGPVRNEPAVPEPGVRVPPGTGDAPPVVQNPARPEPGTGTPPPGRAAPGENGPVTPVRGDNPGSVTPVRGDSPGPVTPVRGDSPGSGTQQPPVRGVGDTPAATTPGPVRGPGDNTPIATSGGPVRGESPAPQPGRTPPENAPVRGDTRPPEIGARSQPPPSTVRPDGEGSVGSPGTAGRNQAPGGDAAPRPGRTGADTPVPVRPVEMETTPPPSRSGSEPGASWPTNRTQAHDPDAPSIRTGETEGEWSFLPNRSDRSGGSDPDFGWPAGRNGGSDAGSTIPSGTRYAGSDAGSATPSGRPAGSDAGSPAPTGRFGSETGVSTPPPARAGGTETSGPAPGTRSGGSDAGGTVTTGGRSGPGETTPAVRRPGTDPTDGTVRPPARPNEGGPAPLDRQVSQSSTGARPGDRPAETSMSSSPPARPEGGSTGRPAEAPTGEPAVAVRPTPRADDPAAPNTRPGTRDESPPLGARPEQGARDLRWEGQQKPKLEESLRNGHGSARAVDDLHPDVHGDFSRVLREADGAGQLGRDKAGKLLKDFEQKVSARFTERMDDAFTNGRPPTSAERAAWGRTYEHLTGRMKLEVRQEVGAAKISASATRLRDEFGATHIDPVTGKPLPNVARAADEFTKDANKLLKGSTGKDVKWDAFAGDLRSLENRFGRYLEVQRGADAAAARAVARFDEVVAARPKGVAADPSRVAALRAELKGAARDAYVSAAGSKSLFRSGDASADLLNKQAATWLRHRDNLIDIRLNWLEQTQHNHARFGARQIGLDHYTSLVRGGVRAGTDEAAEAGAAVRRAYQMVESRSGSFAHNMRPEASVFVRGELGRMAYQAPQQARFGTHAANLLEKAQAQIKTEVAAGERAALNRDLTVTGSAGRVTADATADLVKAGEAAVKNMRRDNFDPDLVAGALADLRRQTDDIVAGVRGRVVDDAALFTADIRADRMIAAEVGGQRATFGQGTRDLYLNRFKQDVLTEFRQTYGTAARPDVAAWLRGRPDAAAEAAARNTLDDLFPKPAVTPDPVTPGTGRPPGAPGGPGIQVFHVRPEMPSIDPTRLSGLLRGEKTDLFPGVDVRGGVPGKGFVDPPGGLPGGTKGDPVMPGGGRPAGDKSPAYELRVTDDVPVSRPGPRNDDPPTYQQARDGDELPSYETARLDPPPAPTRADVQQWMTENAAGAGRSLRMPSQQLDSPMSGLERMIEKIRGEQRDGIAGQVEGLGRVDRPDVKPGGGKEGDDPLDAISRPRDPEAELRDMAWNAMNKYEADLRQTLGDGIRPGSEGGGFAGGPATPARSGQSVAGDFRRFLGGAPEATAIQQRLRDLGNEELDRAHSWLRHQDGPDWAVARGQLDGEWQLRYDRGDLEPGIGTMGAHEALRRLAPPSAPRTVDLDAMRADYLDKARISARIQDLVDRTAVQQAALQDALRRQNLGDVGPRTGAGLQPFESIPARVDELQEMHVKITAAQISGDARVIRATEQLELIVRERAAIAGAVTAVDQAIIAAEKQLTTQFTDPAVRDADPGGYAAAHVELARLRTWREQGLSSFEPAADPARAAMYQRLQNQGLAPALRSPETGPPVTDGRSVLSLMDDLETAIARLGRTPTPQPHDPEWVQTVGQRAADDAVADWVEAYGRVHRTWNDLPMWQRQGPQIRDASLAHFERTAVLQRERAILDVTEPATNSALRQADGQAQRARTQLDLALRERERAVAAAQFAAREAERAAQAATRPVPPPPRPADVPEPVARPADVPEPVARPDDTVPPPIPPSREIVPPPADTKPVTPGGGGKPSQADSDALVRRFQALRNEEPEIEAPPPVVPGGGKPSQADSDALVRRFQALRNAEPEAVPGVGKPRQADADALVRRFQELRGNTPAPVRSETSPTIPVVDLQARFDALRGPKPKPQTDPAAPAPQTDPVVPAPQTDPVVPAPQTDPVVPPPAEQTAPAGTSRQAAAEDLHARFEALRNPSGLRFDDPVRHGEWQTVRAGLIRDLGARFGNARAIDELVPRVETDFVRVLHHTPGTGRLPETRIAEQFTTFTDTVGRAFGTALSGAFSEVRPPTAAERAAWRQRYDELRADLTEDLRRTVGAAEIDRVAEDTFVRWQEADPGLTAVHNEALRHWSRDALQRLDVHHQSRNWSYAENALRDHIRLLDVYRTMHLGAARAADRVGARFDEKLAGRDPFADAERVQQSRAEAVAAAYDRYLGWWRPSRMHHAIADPAGLTARADRSFDVHGDAIGVRLDYLDETQEILDYVNRATTAELLPRSMSVLDEKQLAAMARSVRLEAESLVNRHANPFTVAVPPELTGSWLKRVRIDVTGLVDRIPARAAFAARAAELTGAALPAIGARAADGVAEALSRGLDPTDSFVRVSETARRELMEHVAAARDGFAARGYADGDLAKTLADLEAGIAAIVGRVRIETIRDALLRRGDTEAAGTLGEHAVRPGELLGATVRDRLLNDFEQTYVQRYHDQFADGGRFDVEAWLRTTPPWTEPPRATEVDGPDPVTGGGFVTGDDALVVPAVPETPGSPVVRPETGVGLLPEPEQAAWQERLRAAGDGPALDDVRGDLLERVVEVNAAHQANRTALESMADRFRQAIGQTRPHPVTPAETDWLVRGFLQNTTGLTPRDTTDSEPDVQYPVVSTREPVAVEWGTPVDTSAVPIEYPVVPSTDPRAEAIDRALAEGFQRLFESVIKPLPHRVRETFRARWLAVREDLEAQSAIRQEAAQAAGADWVRTPVAERYPSLTTHQAEEFGKRIDSAATLDEAARIDAEAAAKARARAAAPPDGAVVVAAPKPVDKPAPVLDKIDREYAGVAPAERDRLRQVIANARTPQRLDQAYAELDALRDAAVAAANPKPGPTAEERIRELARAVPRHGYRAVGPDTPPITAAQAAAYEDELGRLPIAEIGAWEVRLFEAGYQRVGPADGSGTTVLPEMPHVPVHDDEIVGAYRAWARDQAGRSGAPRQLADDHADLFATALSSRNGTGLAEALDDFTTALLEARVTRLNGDKSTGPREVAPVPAGAVRADSLPSDPELDAFSARLEQLSRPGPVTQPGTTDDLYPAVPTGTPSRTAEDTAPADPFPVVPASGLTGPGTRPGTGGGSGPDISGMDPEVRRMAEAEGRLGPGAGTNLDDDLARRLARLRPDDEAEPAVQPGTPAVPETPATPTVRPQPGPDAPSGTVDTEMVQPDGTVTLHRQQVTVQRRDDLTRLREQLTEDAAEARTEAETGYRDYLSLDADLRARGQDLATRFRTETQRWQAANPGLADRIGEPTLRQMEQSIADRVLRDFFVVRETLDQRTAQRELIADLIAEQVAKAGPRLDRAASRAEVPPTAGPRVDPVTAERFEQVVREFRRADLFGGRWLNAADYARLRDDFTTIRYADADALGAAAQRLTDELAVAAAGNRWFQRIEAAVQHDRGDDPQESPIPQAEWYRVRFLERLRDDYVRTWGGQPPGTFANGALYQDLRDRDEKQDPRWVPAREDFTATTEWLRQQLTFAAGIREVLVGAARDFDRLLATGGAGMREALTTAALAERFRTDAVRLHLSGRGQPADALDAWLQREKADTDVFGTSLAAHVADRTEAPAAFTARAEQVTGALLTEYTARVRTAAEVASRRPDLTAAVTDRVTEDAGWPSELTGADRDRWREQTVAQLGHLHRQVWRYAIQVGATVGSEHWEAAAQRWNTELERFFDDLRVTATRQVHTDRLAPALEKLRTDATAAGLSRADTEAVAAAFAKTAADEINRGIYRKVSGSSEVDPFEQVRTGLQEQIPDFLEVARIRAGQAAAAARELRDRVAGDGLADAEVNTRANEVADGVRAGFDEAYRQFQWADPDHRLAQAGYAADKARDRLVTEAAERPATTVESETVPPDTAQSGRTAQKALADLAEEANDLFAGLLRTIPPTERGGLRRVAQEIQEILDRAEKTVEDGTFTAGGADRAVAAARTRITGIVTAVPERLAQEQRLAAALETAGDRFDDLPGARDLEATDPLRQAFLSDVAGRIGIGNAGLTSAAQHDLVRDAAHRRRPAPEQATDATTGAPAAETTITSPAPVTGTLPTVLPPVEVTPLTSRPPDTTVTTEPPETPAITVDPETAFRADLAARAGDLAVPAPVENFPAGLAGEQAQIHWSLETLAHHGGRWLDEGVRYLDEPDPAVRARYLVDAALNAPADALLAFSRLSRGVGADAELDLPVAIALQAMHLALHGEVAEAENMMRTTWKRTFPSREGLIEAIVGRDGTAADRAALQRLGIALVTC